MKNLFILTLLINIASLHGMEVPGKQKSMEVDWSEIIITMPNRLTLPQIYYLFKYEVFPVTDIAEHLFSAYPYIHTINKDIGFLCKECQKTPCDHSVSRLDTCIKVMLNYTDYYSVVEILKQSLLRHKLSICDIKSWSDKTVLNGIDIVESSYLDNSHLITSATKIYLEVAGNEVWKLLTAKKSDKASQTPLHCVAGKGYVDLVKLFLETAGKFAHILIDMQDGKGRTAFDVATPEVKEIMKPYLGNK